MCSSDLTAAPPPPYLTPQHWTYTLDMVDSYLGVFPDKEAHLLWNSEPVPFYLSPAIVRSRADRYKIVPNSNKPGTSALRVYSAVSCKILPDTRYPVS